MEGKRLGGRGQRRTNSSRSPSNIASILALFVCLLLSFHPFLYNLLLYNRYESLAFIQCHRQGTRTHARLASSCTLQRVNLLKFSLAQCCPTPSLPRRSLDSDYRISLSLSLAVLRILRGVWRRDAPLNLHHPLSQVNLSPSLRRAAAVLKAAA